jgi:hypothetical protein
MRFSKYLKSKVVGLTAAAILGAVGWHTCKDPSPKAGVDYKAMINNATQIKIKEKWLNSVLPLAKKYYILADGKYAGMVKGRLITEFGNVFTLTTLDGKDLAYEKEEKRRLWNLRWLNRAAVVYNANSEQVGWITEEKIKDFFAIHYMFHLYDKDMDEIGVSKKITKSSMGTHNLIDAKGNKDYDIDKYFWKFPGRDVYMISVLDKKSEIPRTQAILLTCIEDIIADNN